MAGMRDVTDRSLQTADGLELHLADFGGDTGPPLLFVHGSFGHARVWDFLVVQLPPSRRALAVDLPGHGDSAHAHGRERYAFARLVEDLRAVVAGLDDRPVLVGHSIGSAVAMYYAAAWPETLAGAVFMDIDPCPPDYQAKHLNEAGTEPPKTYASLDRAVARESRLAPAASPAVHMHLARHGYRPGASGRMQKFDQAFLRSIETWDARGLLPRITVPVLVLRGGESIVMSEQGYRELMEGLPFARGEVVFGATHQLHLDRPLAVATLIEAFAFGLS